eukprot:gene31157-37654_t
MEEGRIPQSHIDHGPRVNMALWNPAFHQVRGVPSLDALYRGARNKEPFIYHSSFNPYYCSMGRPRALKKVDKVPAVEPEAYEVARRTRSHVTFNDDEDDSKKLDTQSTPLENVSSEKTAKPKQKAVAEVEQPDDQPEEVVADSAQIQQLKDLYEMTLSKSSSNKLKKKRRAALVVEPAEEIDVETLEAAVAAGQKEEADKKEDSERIEESQGENKKRKLTKIVGKSLKIAVLEEKPLNPLDHFKVSHEALEFAKARHNSVPRMKYTTYISQRKAAPAKKFAAK